MNYLYPRLHHISISYNHESVDRHKLQESIKTGGVSPYTLPEEIAKSEHKKAHQLTMPSSSQVDALVGLQLNTEKIRALAAERGLQKETLAKSELEKKRSDIYTQNIRYLPKVLRIVAFVLLRTYCLRI
jgi:hypothetical protein